MAVATIVATAGSASANSYITRTEGNTFDDNRPASSGNDWSVATNTAKDEALLWSTIQIDSLFVWTGAVTDSTQVLQWPRQGMVERNRRDAVATDAIPTELKNAQAEFARQLIAEDRAADSDIESKGITQLKAGPVFMQFSSDVRAKVIPDAVANLIPEHWYSRIVGRPSGMRELVRA